MGRRVRVTVREERNEGLTLSPAGDWAEDIEKACD